MSAVISATLGATIAVSQNNPPTGENGPATLANPNISERERVAGNILDVVESPTYNYGVMGTFGTLAAVQGGIAGYGAAASAVGGACSLGSGGALVGIATGAGTALAPLAVAVAAGAGGLATGDRLGHGIADLAGMNRVATEGEAPARLGDAIAHQNKTWGVLGAIAGVIAGVAVVAAVGIFTGGAGLVVLGSSLLGAMATAGAAAAVGGVIAGIGSALGQYGDNKGIIAEGSPNVFFNNKAVARAGDAVTCSDHTWPAPPVIAEGAKTVFANGRPVARLGHRTSCDGNINSASGNITLTRQTGNLVAEIKDSRSLFARSVSAVLNTVMTAIGLKQSVSGIGNALKQTATVGEPVDIVTGDFLQQWPLLRLEGVLPLTLERLYRSTRDFDADGCFGKKWACGWSQHLVLHGETVDFINEEGVLLTYHTPDARVNAVNLRQPHCILGGDQTDVLTVYNRETQQTLFFAHRSGNRRHLSAIADRSGNRIRFIYGGQGLAAVEHSDGYRLAVASENGRILTVDLEDGAERRRLLTCRYDEAGWLTACHSFQFGQVFHEYDRHGRMTRWRDTDSTRAVIRYDERGRVTATETAEGFYNDRFIYDDAARHNIYIDAEGGESHYFYNENGLVTRVIDPPGYESTTEWALTRKVAESDQTGRVTRFSYGERGELLETAHPDGRKTRYEYNHAGQITAVTAPSGEAWRCDYGDTGLLRRVTGPAGAVEYRYDAQGRILRETAPGGGEWRYHYDDAGLLSEARDPVGAITRWQRDRLGRVWQQTNAEGGTVRYEHSSGHASPEGSVTAVHYPDGSTQRIHYDGERRVREQVDGEGRATRYFYTAFDLLTGHERPDGGRVQYHYDRLARLTGITSAAGDHYHLRRDRNGRVVEERDFTGRSLRYVYDAAGRLRVRQCGGRVTTFRYDINDRLIMKCCWQSTETVSLCEQITAYEYDGAGRLVKADNEESTVAFRYDGAGRLAGESTDGQDISLARDAAGRITAQSLAGRTLNFSWRDDGLPQALQPAGHLPLALEYDGAGREVLRRSEAGFVLAQHYGRNGLLARQAGGTDALIAHRTPLSEGYRPLSGNAVNRRYGYDRAFNVTGIHDERWGKSRYGYDAGGQVAEALLAGHGGSFTALEYDADRNIRSRRIIRRPWLDAEAINTAPDEEITQRQRAGRQAALCGDRPPGDAQGAADGIRKAGVGVAKRAVGRNGYLEPARGERR